MLEIDPILHHPQPHRSIDLLSTHGQDVTSDPNPKPELFSFSRYPSSLFLSTDVLGLDGGSSDGGVIPDRQPPGIFDLGHQARQSQTQQQQSQAHHYQQQQLLHHPYSHHPQQNAYQGVVGVDKHEDNNSSSGSRERRERLERNRHRRQLHERQLRHRTSPRRQYSIRGDMANLKRLDYPVNEFPPSDARNFIARSSKSQRRAAAAEEGGGGGGAGGRREEGGEVGGRNLYGVRKGGSGENVKTWRTETEFEAEFDRVWRLLWESEETHKFRTYRCNWQRRKAEEAAAGSAEEERPGTRRKGRKKRSKESSKQAAHANWTPEAEHALFRAIVRHGPIGKKKEFVDSVLKGRNELVSLSIEQQNGELLNRKKISSHLQHIRPFFTTCPPVLQYFPKKKPGKANGERKVAKKRSGTSRLLHHPVKFQITLHPGRDDKDELLPPEHIYTTLSSSSFSKSAPNHGRFYPHIIDVTSRDSLECDILMFDVSIALTARVLLSPIELGTTFNLAEGSDLGGYSDLESCCQFFNSGQPGEFSRQQFEYDEQVRKIPFGSDCWAKIIAQLSRQLHTAQMSRKIAELEPGPHLETASQIERKVRDTLENLSVTQKIFGTHAVGGERRQLMCNLWRFRMAEEGQSGETKWHRLDMDKDESKLQRRANASATLKNEASLTEANVGIGAEGPDSLPLDFLEMQLDHEADDAYDHKPIGANPTESSWEQPIVDAVGQRFDDGSDFPGLEASTFIEQCRSAMEEFAPHAHDDIDFQSGNIDIDLGTGADVGLDLDHLVTSGDREVMDAVDADCLDVSGSGGGAYPELDLSMTAFDDSQNCRYPPTEQTSQLWGKQPEVYGEEVGELEEEGSQQDFIVSAVDPDIDGDAHDAK